MTLTGWGLEGERLLGARFPLARLSQAPSRAPGRAAEPSPCSRAAAAEPLQPGPSSSAPGARRYARRAMKLLRLPPLLLALSACAAPRQETRTAVPEGINDSFFGADADVDRFAERWELESREVYANREEILATLELQPGETVADIGTGTGLYVEPFAAAVGPEGRVLAVDISPKFIFHVRARAGGGSTRWRSSSRALRGAPERSVDAGPVRCLPPLRVPRGHAALDPPRPGPAAASSSSTSTVPGGRGGSWAIFGPARTSSSRSRRWLPHRPGDRDLGLRGELLRALVWTERPGRPVDSSCDATRSAGLLPTRPGRC